MTSIHRFTILFLLCLGAASAPAQSFLGSWGTGSGEGRKTLTVKADGSCRLSSESVLPRKTAELQVRSWERYATMAEGLAEDEAPPAQLPKPDQKPLSDDELASKIRELQKTRLDSSEESEQEIESLEVTTNSVRVVTSRTFGSVKELLAERLWSWGPEFLMVENARFETDPNGLLRLTLTPSRGSEQYSRAIARQWKSGKIKADWRIELPGEVVASTLPETKDNATWVVIDASKPESLDAVLKLVGAPVVITAEAGGLKLDAALDSRELVRVARRGSPGQSDMPITDAGPGFVAEPVGLTLTTVHYFPEGKNHFKDPPAYWYGMESTGTVVNVKLFPPQGRTIQSVSNVRVLRAKDDQGRAVAAGDGDGAGQELVLHDAQLSFGSSDKSGAARLELRLGLPAGDAQTIEELEAEGVVLSIGGWKELTVTNVQADAQKEIDLSEILPGAKLFITKVTGRRPQTTVQARLEGPAGVDQLDVKLKLSGERGSSHMSGRPSRTSGGKTVRTVTVQGYDFEMARRTGTAPVTLMVRSPQDLKRERVRFKLTALDLL